MNTFKQMIELNDKLQSIMDMNNGVVQLTFYEGKEITVRVLSVNTSYNFNEKNYLSTITTFTNDINQTTLYDFGTVWGINWQPKITADNN